MAETEIAEVIEKLDLAVRLLYMQTKEHVGGLRTKLVQTKKQDQLYEALTGERTAEEAAKAARCSLRLAQKLLPEWERAGLILAVGKGPNKKYTSLENLEL